MVIAGRARPRRRLGGSMDRVHRGWCRRRTNTAYRRPKNLPFREIYPDYSGWCRRFAKNCEHGGGAPVTMPPQAV